MNKWILLSDCEIVTEGTKKECIDRYKSMPKPIPMKLIKVCKDLEIYFDLNLKKHIIGNEV